jgi:hypothetical protein
MLELVMGRHETKANHADRMSTLQSQSHSQGDRERPETNKSKLPIRFRPQLYFKRVSRSKDQRPARSRISIPCDAARAMQCSGSFLYFFSQASISLPRTTPHYLLPSDPRIWSSSGAILKPHLWFFFFFLHCRCTPVQQHWAAPQLVGRLSPSPSSCPKARCVFVRLCRSKPDPYIRTHKIKMLHPLKVHNLLN